MLLTFSVLFGYNQAQRLDNMEAFECMLMILSFLNSMSKSCMFIFIINLQENYSQSEFDEKNMINLIVEWSFCILSIPLQFAISYILSQNRKYYNNAALANNFIKLGKFLFIPICYSILNFALQTTAYVYRFDYRLYILLSNLLNALQPSTWFYTVVNEMIIVKSKNRARTYMYLKAASICSKFANIVMALTLSEYEILWIIAPILLFLKPLVICAYHCHICRSGSMDLTNGEQTNNVELAIIIDENGHDGCDRSENSNKAEKVNEFKTLLESIISNPISIFVLLSWVLLYYAQRCAYIYTQTLHLNTKQWRIATSLQYIGFAIVLLVCGKFVKNSQYPYILLILYRYTENFV